MAATNVTLTTTSDKVAYLELLSKLQPSTLQILADLAKKPGVEQKLRDNHKMLKLFI